MGFKEEVRAILEQLEVVDPQVKILEESGTRILAQVVSSSFEGMEDWKRQRLVWSKLLDALGDDRSRWVEFVFTESPAEAAASEPAEQEVRS